MSSESLFSSAGWAPPLTLLRANASDSCFSRCRCSSILVSNDLRCSSIRNKPSTSNGVPRFLRASRMRFGFSRSTFGSIMSCLRLLSPVSCLLSHVSSLDHSEWSQPRHPLGQPGVVHDAYDVVHVLVRGGLLFGHTLAPPAHHDDALLLQLALDGPSGGLPDRLGARHDAPGSMAAAAEALRHARLGADQHVGMAAHV